MLLTGLLLCSGPAGAESSRKPDSPVAAAPAAFNSSASRLVVDHFSGSGAASVPRAGVINALEAEDTVDLLSVRVLDAERGALDGSPAGYARVAQRFDLGAIIRGKVKSNREGARITLTVISGRDGKAFGKLSFEAATLPELRTKLQKELWSELEPLLHGREAAAPPRAAAEDDAREAERGAPDSEPEPEQPEEPKAAAEKAKPAPEPEPEAEPQSKPQPKPAALPCPRLEFELGGGAQGRLFNYVNEQRGALRAYRGSAAPLARGDFTGFPLASSSCRVRGGIALGYERLLKVESQLAGTSLPSAGFGGHAELVLRLALGQLSLEPGLGYADRHFQVDGGFVPDANYHALRARLHADLALGRFLLELRSGGHFLLTTGRLQNANWFPGAKGRGYDADARVGVQLLNWLDVLLGVHYEYYSFDLNPQVDGAYPHGVALGAYDKYFDGTLSLRFRL